MGLEGASRKARISHSSQRIISKRLFRGCLKVGENFEKGLKRLGERRCFPEKENGAIQSRFLPKKRRKSGTPGKHVIHRGKGPPNTVK